MKRGMSSRQCHLRSVMSEVLHVAVWCALLAGVGYGQTSQDQVDEILSPKVRSVIDSLKRGVYGPATQEQVAEAQAGLLIPMLETRFVTSKDTDVKARIAHALVNLGDNDNAYWDFLVQQAKLAIESDAPSPRCFSSANYVLGHPPEYVAWARAHNVPEGSQAEMALNWLPGKVYLVSGDPRGIPLLREALKSPNINVVSTGADGLTRALDKDSIPLIVQACKRFHGEEVPLISHTLRRFMTDPDARAAAQAGEQQCLPPPDPIEALKRNDGDPRFYLGKAAATHPEETVAILKKNFVNTKDERHKAQIASALIELGDKDNIYWDFLLRQAISVLEGDTSSAVKNDSQGKPSEGPSSYDAWARQDADLNMMLIFVETVAETLDPRGIQFLRRALSSPSFQGDAAAGLVRAQDNDSIPLIIDLCKNASPEEARFFAMQVLVYFDDPRAQSAVDQYLSKEDAKFAREQKANGVGPLGPWPPK